MLCHDLLHYPILTVVIIMFATILPASTAYIPVLLKWSTDYGHCVIMLLQSNTDYGDMLLLSITEYGH